MERKPNDQSRYDAEELRERGDVETRALWIFGPMCVRALNVSVLLFMRVQVCVSERQESLSDYRRAASGKLH